MNLALARRSLGDGLLDLGGNIEGFDFDELVFNVVDGTQSLLPKARGCVDPTVPLVKRKRKGQARLAPPGRTNAAVHRKPGVDQSPSRDPGPLHIRRVRRLRQEAVAYRIVTARKAMADVAGTWARERGFEI